jgi:hypothetical protein
MMSTSESSICDVCGRMSHGSRMYYYYDMDCKCCNGDKHFEYVFHCATCLPEPPKSIVITPSTPKKKEMPIKVEVSKFSYIEQARQSHIHLSITFTDKTKNLIDIQEIDSMVEDFERRIHRKVQDLHNVDIKIQD